MRKMWIVARKEWSEVFKNRMVLFTVAFMPLMLTALPLILLSSIGSSGDMGGMSVTDLPSGFAQMCGGLTGGECAQYYFVSSFMLLFMILPLAIPATIASYSIVGEKTTRTLEPLLATPITTLELLAGKAAGAAIPAILATWGAFLVFAVGAMLLSVGQAVVGRLLDPLWLTAVFVVGPLLALAAVSVAVMVSSRVTDPRVAEQLSVLVILPLLLLFAGNMTGFIIINDTLILWMTGILVVVDAILFTFAVRLFQRESILTRWK